VSGLAPRRFRCPWVRIRCQQTTVECNGRRHPHRRRGRTVGFAWHTAGGALSLRDWRRDGAGGRRDLWSAPRPGTGWCADAGRLVVVKVKSAATQELMVDYNPCLLNGRSGTLRAAQKTMVANATRQHPCYWAAFILIGDWTPQPAVR
jgi:hypothetical protein